MATQATLPNPAQEKEYWVENFKVKDDDLEYIFNMFLETEEPLGLREITIALIEFRLKQEATRIKRQIASGAIFQPKNNYKVGQTIVFPSLGYIEGEVKGVRAGSNTEYGEFNVIEVVLDNGETQEFAASLTVDHALNIDPEANLAGDEIDPTVILRNYGRAIARKLKTSFDEDPDVVYLAGRWFLKSLLADINIAHLHLAEAILDINGGGPMKTDEIFREIGLKADVKNDLQIFSLDYALQKDERFDEVGPAGQVLWFLARMEPPAVRKAPLQLQYTEIPFNSALLNEDMRTILLDIDDELSPIEGADEDAEEVTITLTYPYRRTGTLPLSARLQSLFPTAYETNRIRMTLVDAQSNEEVAGWVVRELGYVYGFEEFFKRYMLPVGAYITLRRQPEDPTKLIVDFRSRKRARTEWIKLAVPEGHMLHFQNHKRAIGADYDELMNFGVEDVAGLDALWPRYQNLPLVEIMRRLMPELANLTPQQAVHVTTLYSAINMLRRCPPDPIFSTLVSSPEFENVGGPYWRMVASQS